jgi:hypothetical protein
MQIANTPEEIQAYRMLSLKGALKLELLGFKRRGPSVFSIVKREFGLRGNRQAVFDQYVQLLRDRGILPKTDKP